MKITRYKYAVPVTIALLSDLHNKPYSQIISQVRELEPDIIAVTGDVVFGRRPENNTPITQQQENILPFLRECAHTAQTFFSLGNHEWLLCERDLELIRSTGAVILDNSFVGYRGITIGGLTSARRNVYEAYVKEHGASELLYPEIKSDIPRSNEEIPKTSWLDEFESVRGFKLLLCHHPEYRDKFLKNRKIDLILCGHCHGGQIRVFDHGLFAPGQGWWPKYTKGIHGNMIISTGLSNTGGVIPRLFNPPEIVYISSDFVFENDNEHTPSIIGNPYRTAFECAE